MQDLTNLYKNSRCLYELDYSTEGFRYIDADNADQSLYIYARFAKNKDDHYLIVMNCTPNSYFDYKIGVPGKYDYIEILNSDKDIYGGSNNINPEVRKSQEEHRSEHSQKYLRQSNEKAFDRYYIETAFLSMV